MRFPLSGFLLQVFNVRVLHQWPESSQTPMSEVRIVIVIIVLDTDAILTVRMIIIQSSDYNSNNDRTDIGGIRASEAALARSIAGGAPNWNIFCQCVGLYACIQVKYHGICTCINKPYSSMYEYISRWRRQPCLVRQKFGAPLSI